ncbi:unnamed protein product [Macrosiphum euphorbiae]|uniref:Uncharacterized protein n=1 Tax=Macrosiphum euphorbiae TaxID=13131 RepID=A0AAV0WRH2_9HEMI|nr:unnamed protein product [Macrosiphum euphorbiae]
MINTLLNIKDITNTNERAQRINQELDDILDKGHSEKIEIAPYIHDHEYSLTDTSSLVLSYLAGYVARKSTRFTKCQRCLLSLKNQVISSRDKLIDMRSKGFLIRPSDSIFALISTLEKITLQTLVSEELNVNTIFSITSNLWTDTASFPFVGCSAGPMVFGARCRISRGPIWPMAEYVNLLIIIQYTHLFYFLGTFLNCL